MQPGADGEFYDGTAGETITAGMPCYLSATDNKLYKADANTLSQANVKGLSTHGASASQPLRVQTDGAILLGATANPPVGTVYWLSETAGGIAPFVDLDAGGMYGTYLGVANADDELILNIHATGVLLAAFDSSP